MKNVSFLLAICLLYACNSAEPTCKYGDPVAIFSPDLPGVKKHTFNQDGQQAHEELFFKNGVHVDVMQSGCNAVEQEFRFTIPEVNGPQEDEFWKSNAVQLFHYLGNLSPQHAEYHQYATTIEQLSKDIKFGEQIQLGSGFGLQMDRIQSKQAGLLQVIFRQGVEED